MSKEESIVKRRWFNPEELNRNVWKNTNDEAVREFQIKEAPPKDLRQLK